MVKFWSLTVKLPVAEIDKRATTGFGEGVVRAVGLGLGELVPSGLVAGDGLRSAVGSRTWRVADVWQRDAQQISTM
jgi:hypothetical protein